MSNNAFHSLNAFGGENYLDASSSDPHTLQWMQGAPPPMDKLVRFEDGRVLAFPEIRWSLSHVRELGPTTNVWRGLTPAQPLGAASHTQAIDALTFTDLQGSPRTWGSSLDDAYTDGIIVLHRGRCIYERYMGALQAHMPHACFSVTKSIAATLAATLVYEGVLDAQQHIAYYLPEMADTAYGDATLRQLLDMQIGVSYTETYADPQADIWKYARAANLSPRPADYNGPEGFYAYLQTLRKAGEHGQVFAYKTVNTEVLGWIMKRVVGKGLEALLSERIWARLGAEQDAFFTVDSLGTASAGGGLSTSLRDLARYGEMMRCNGTAHGQQLVPAAVVADIQRGADATKFAAAGYALLQGYSYRNMWWVSHNPWGMYEARGIHGQRIYIAPGAELVVARFASHPIAANAANDVVTLPAFESLCRHVAG